jgi:DNA-binding GntR family transcriptional regulator
LQFQDLYELRLLLEPHGAAKAAESMTEQSLAALRQITEAMVDDGSHDAQIRYSNFARKDADFHDFILRTAGNDLVRETLRVQHTHFHIFRLMYHWRVTEEALDEHAAIMSALTHGDGPAARKAMANHIENSMARLAPAFT